MTKISLRVVENSDREQLWLWSNDPTVRANSFATQPISWDEHCHWFASRLADPLWRAWLGIDTANQPIGVVRFQMSGNRAEISVNVAATARGQGWGRALIAQGCARLFNTTSITTVDAFIKPNNNASVAAFCAVGFQEIDHEIRILGSYQHLVLNGRL